MEHGDNAKIFKNASRFDSLIIYLWKYHNIYYALEPRKIATVPNKLISLTANKNWFTRPHNELLQETKNRQLIQHCYHIIGFESNGSIDKLIIIIIGTHFNENSKWACNESAALICMPYLYFPLSSTPQKKYNWRLYH